MKALVAAPSRSLLDLMRSATRSFWIYSLLVQMPHLDLVHTLCWHLWLPHCPFLPGTPHLAQWLVYGKHIYVKVTSSLHSVALNKQNTKWRLEIAKLWLPKPLGLTEPPFALQPQRVRRWTNARATPSRKPTGAHAPSGQQMGTWSGCGASICQRCTKKRRRQQSENGQVHFLRRDGVGRSTWPGSVWWHVLKKNLGGE